MRSLNPNCRMTLNRNCRPRKSLGVVVNNDCSRLWFWRYSSARFRVRNRYSTRANELRACWSKPVLLAMAASLRIQAAMRSVDRKTVWPPTLQNNVRSRPTPMALA